MGFVIPAFVFAAVAAEPAMAQEKAKEAKTEKAAKAEKGKPTTKVLLENDKVRVTETRFKPGDESASITRLPRVTRALKGGTLTRVYPDGKTDKSEYKTGEVKYFAASPEYKVKNAGKTEIILYSVNMK